MSTVLKHASPECTGHWRSMSATGMRPILKGVKGRPKSGYFVICDKCHAYFSQGDRGVQLEHHRIMQAERGLTRAMREQRAAKAMEAAMRACPPDSTPEDWADAALRGLRQAFLQVSEDVDARFSWESDVKRITDPVSQQVRAVLDGAFINFRIVRIQTPVGGGVLRYTVALETRCPTQETVIESVIAAIHLPAQFTEINVDFIDRDEAA